MVEDERQQSLVVLRFIMEYLLLVLSGEPCMPPRIEKDLNDALH